MNWHRSLALLDIVEAIYWTIVVWSDLFALLCRIGIYFKPKFERPFWIFVKIFRFVFPIRKLMYVLLYTVAIDHFPLKWYDYISLVVYTYWAFFLKDDFGDDDRKKKPSKVRAFIKSLGHRLVVQHT